MGALSRETPGVYHLRTLISEVLQGHRSDHTIIIRTSAKVRSGPKMVMMNLMIFLLC